MLDKCCGLRVSQMLYQWRRQATNSKILKTLLASILLCRSQFSRRLLVFLLRRRAADLRRRLPAQLSESDRTLPGQRWQCIPMGCEEHPSNLRERCQKHGLPVALASALGMPVVVSSTMQVSLTSSCGVPGANASETVWLAAGASGHRHGVVRVCSPVFVSCMC